MTIAVRRNKPAGQLNTKSIHEYLANFRLGPGASRSKVSNEECARIQFKKYKNEFWTAQQRQALSLHEVSYRACFKPQLPAFFINLLTAPGDHVYDPFLGRGTTAVEAALLGRRPLGNDINPLSEILTRPRLEVPTFTEVLSRIASIKFSSGLTSDIDLSMFFHKDTLSEILSLRNYFLTREASGKIDKVDRWIRMVATNRLTGHSTGFFSVYTLPPNQATTPSVQIKINEKRAQTPPYRDVKNILIKKSRVLLSDLNDEIRSKMAFSRDALLLTGDCRKTMAIPKNTVQLTVTSPPFLDIVAYAKDNWMRCWFNGINAESVGRGITMARSVDQWTATMGQLLQELHRITRPGGYVAFEVGEVRRGTIRLDEHVVPAGVAAGFECVAVIINEQQFTKTANIWGVKNNDLGTNTNRIVLFSKP